MATKGRIWFFERTSETHERRKTTPNQSYPKARSADNRKHSNKHQTTRDSREVDENSLKLLTSLPHNI